MDLNQPDQWKSLDSLGVESAIKLFPEQIKEAWGQSVTSNIEPIKCDSVVISGMGGSADAGKIIQGLFENKIKIPIHAHNDYGLPAWVNPNTLIVLSSYSGNTEETLSAVAPAQKTGAKIIGVTTGGKVGEIIKNGEIPGAILSPTTNPTKFPKTGLGVSLGGLLGALAKASVVPTHESELFSAVSELTSLRDNFQEDAKGVALWLKDSLPILFGGRPLLGSLNAARNAMDEISRVFSLFFDFPEVDHVLVEATQLPSLIKEKAKYLFFISKFHHERVKLRYRLTQDIFKKQALTFMDYELKGATELVQALELPNFCTWVAFYLSILYGNDPGPEPWIIELKNSLSQPIH